MEGWIQRFIKKGWMGSTFKIGFQKGMVVFDYYFWFEWFKKGRFHFLNALFYSSLAFFSNEREEGFPTSTPPPLDPSMACVFSWEGGGSKSFLKLLYYVHLRTPHIQREREGGGGLRVMPEGAVE
jgi:hypothetical protein